MGEHLTAKEVDDRAPTHWAASGGAAFHIYRAFVSFLGWTIYGPYSVVTTRRLV